MTLNTYSNRYRARRTFRGTYIDLDKADQEIKNAQKCFEKLLNILSVNVNDISNFNSEEIDPLKIELNNIKNGLSKIESNLTTIHYEINDLENEYEQDKSIWDEERDSLEAEIQEINDLINELKNIQNFDSPSGYYEQELFSLVIRVYNNGMRLNNADREILKVLSEKTL